jgi:hypothetical protein
MRAAAQRGVMTFDAVLRVGLASARGLRLDVEGFGGEPDVARAERNEKQ